MVRIEPGMMIRLLLYRREIKLEGGKGGLRGEGWVLLKVPRGDIDQGVA